MIHIHRIEEPAPVPLARHIKIGLAPPQVGAGLLKFGHGVTFLWASIHSRARAKYCSTVSPGLPTIGTASQTLRFAARWARTSRVAWLRRGHVGLSHVGSEVGGQMQPGDDLRWSNGHVGSLHC